MIAPDAQDRVQRSNSANLRFVPELVRIRTHYVSSVSAITLRRAEPRHGSALAHKTHIFQTHISRAPSPDRARPPGGRARGSRWRRRRRSGSASPTRRAGRGRGADRAGGELPPRRSASASTASALPAAPGCAANARKLSQASPAASRRRPSTRSAPASPAATRPPSPPTAATAASTSSTTAPGNRSAAQATRPRLPSPSRTTGQLCSTRSRAPAPGPSAADLSTFREGHRASPAGTC